MKSDIIFEFDCSDNQNVIPFIRQKVSEWADSIPHHGLSDVGQQIEIEQLFYRPYYKFTLTTQYEQRKKLPQSRPYSGGNINESTVRDYSAYSQWDMPMTESTGYETASYTELVPGSKKISDCSRCKTTGQIICPTCSGKGRDTCPDCHGEGEEKCSSCYGSGRVNCSSCHGSGKSGHSSCTRCRGTGQVPKSGYSDTSQGYAACPSCGGSGKGPATSCSSCGGSGKVSCSSCHGSGKKTCKKCGGDGIVTCSHCHGNKKITCPTCDGHKQVLEFLEVGQHFKPLAETTTVTNYDVGNAFPDFSNQAVNEDAAEIFSDSAENSLPEDLFSDLPINRAFNDFRTHQLKESSFGEINYSIKILRQHITVGKIDVYDLFYTFRGKSYRVLIYGNSGKTYALESPFNEMSEDCFGKSKKLYKQGRIGESMNYLMAAYNMDTQHLMRDEQNEFYNKLLDKFKASYRKNTIVGTLISIVIFAYLSLVVYSKPLFIFPFIKDVYVESLPAVHSIVMGLFFILFALLLIPKISNVINNRFHGDLTKAAGRAIFVIVFTLFSDTLLWAGLLLASSTSVPLIISRFLMSIDPVMQFFDRVIPLLLQIIQGV